MTATAWTKASAAASAWSSTQKIANLGVLMNDTVYTMNSTTATMNDEKANPLKGQPVAWTKT